MPSIYRIKSFLHCLFIRHKDATDFELILLSVNKTHTILAGLKAHRILSYGSWFYAINFYYIPHFWTQHFFFSFFFNLLLNLLWFCFETIWHLTFFFFRHGRHGNYPTSLGPSNRNHRCLGNHSSCYCGIYKS